MTAKAIDANREAGRAVSAALRHKLLCVVTRDAENGKHPAPAHALAIMLDALDRAEKDPRGLLDGIADNFCGRLAHRLLKAAGLEVTPELQRRIR